MKYSLIIIFGAMIGAANAQTVYYCNKAGKKIITDQPCDKHGAAQTKSVTSQFDQAGRRRYYRLIEKEKRRLIDEIGVDPEEVRLLCRYLANLKNSNAEQRWKAYIAQFRLPI